MTSDAIVAAYNSVRLWAQAVDEAGTGDPEAVRELLGRQSLDAPEGIVSIDPETRHTWRPFYVGRVRADGQFDIVWSLAKPIRPIPLRRHPAAGGVGRLRSTTSQAGMGRPMVVRRAGRSPSAGPVGGRVQPPS